jgi:hypothetical protein
MSIEIHELCAVTGMKLDGRKSSLKWISIRRQSQSLSFDFVRQSQIIRAK